MLSLARLVLCTALVLLVPPSQETAAAPEANRSTLAAASSTVNTPAPQDNSNVEISVSSSNSVGETILEFILLAILLGLSFAIVGTFVGGFAAVSIFMDTGCLRFVVFGLGWIPSAFAGFLVGIFVGEATGLEFLTGACAQLGFWGYPIGWGWGLYKVNQLPEDEYVTWKRTLTGGALLGTGAGSALSLTRSAAALFKGGGGSFGGGGASGSFGSAQVGHASAAAAPIASGTGAGSGGGGAALGAASGSAVAGVETATSNDSAPHNADENSDESSWIRRRIQNFFHWTRHLRWYHGCAFVLIALIFIPVGLGAAAWMQDPNVLTFVIAATALVTGYRLWRRWAASSASETESSSNSRPSFRGGGASTTWK